MGEQKPEKVKKHICTGLLAHVDAGKTTLSEALLYTSGSIRKLGRVDNQNAFLDTYKLERERGITIFSKQAVMQLDDKTMVTLLDTPGHVDFSAEMERTLQVLDYAILVISGADGVQGHTETLWRLLSKYQVPTFLFINKMDQAGTDETALMAELKNRLSDCCVDFSAGGADAKIRHRNDAFLESAAVCDEQLLEMYLENGNLSLEDISESIRQRKLFPCFFGSALKMTGIDLLIQGMSDYMKCPEYPDAFGAKVYKITRDEQGTRLTYMKITGGNLSVKEMLSGYVKHGNGQEEENWQEKVNQILSLIHI